MPSLLVGSLSGGVRLVSGNPWSGQAPPPVVGLVQLRRDVSAGGILYVGLSGGVTINSGGYVGVPVLSGGTALSGMLDGIPVARGEVYSIPKLAVGLSGFINIWLAPDAAASGSRLYFDLF